jgi:hypothetical protein
METALQNLTVNNENWKDIRQMLPAELHRGLTFENGCWTFSDDPRSIRNRVPLRIARALVIVLVYTPPFGRPENESPPDPYPDRIDPFVKATDNVICSLLETFDFALGFYILYNGHLQIWARGGDSFDRQLAASRYPRRFGGLKVSYFTQGPCATSSIVETSGQDPIHMNGSQTTNTGPPFGCGSEIEIRPQSQRSRIGVALEMRDASGTGTYVTIATHAAIAQPKQPKQKKQRSLWKSLTKHFHWRDKKPRDNSCSWWNGIEVYKAGTNVRVCFELYLIYLNFLTRLVG